MAALNLLAPLNHHFLLVQSTLCLRKQNSIRIRSCSGRRAQENRPQSARSEARPRVGRNRRGSPCRARGLRRRRISVGRGHPPWFRRTIWYHDPPL